MNNAIYMTDAFEKEKNVKASAITLGVAVALALLLILIKWPIPVMHQPVAEDFMEVNLGSGDIGSGNDQPLLPGEPAPEQQAAYTPPQPVHATASDVKDIETDDRNEDAPAITLPAVILPNATKINDNNKVFKTTNTTPAPVATPAPPRPKAVMGQVRGGNGNGGNGADTYKPGTGEGIAGGAGDQGRVGGNPNGTNYNGPKKSFGVRVLQITDQSFEDDFNENAKVAMDVEANADGKVLSATYQPRGSTTSNRKMIDIARRRAFELKLGSSDGGQRGTVVFNFKVRG
jgi:hypothetical protein